MQITARLGAFLTTALLGLLGPLAGADPAPGALPTVGPVTTVYTFDASQYQYTEGLAIDKHGNVYVGLYYLGEIWKFAPDGTASVYATLDIGNQGGGLVGLALDQEGNLYACVASWVQGTHGIWKIDRSGNASLFAALDPFAQPVAPLTPFVGGGYGYPAASYGFPNAIAVGDDGDLYVSDSYLALIWKIRRSGAVSVLIQDPLLDYISYTVGGQGIGANGLEFDRGSLFVANTDHASIVRIRMPDDGQAAHAAVYAQDPALLGADGIAFDSQHNLYVANDLIATLARVTPTGAITTLATASAGLDYPASTSFGQTSGKRKTLYFTNSGGYNANPPSLQKIDVGVDGTPLP